MSNGHTDPTYPLDLTIAAVFRDEASYLQEWIEFHLMVGVQQFVLVNDRSCDGFRSVLYPYVEAGVVELIDLPSPADMQGSNWVDYQVTTLATITDQLRGVTRWLALIDLDEFIVPYRSRDLVEMLSPYEDAGAVHIEWRPFGTSYVPELARDRLMTEQLVMCADPVADGTSSHDRLGKSIVKPHRVSAVDNHRCALLPPYRYVELDRTEGPETSPAGLHHYWARDEAHLFGVKIPRKQRLRNWESAESARQRDVYRHLYNDRIDDSMSRFLPELRRCVHTTEGEAADRFRP